MEPLFDDSPEDRALLIVMVLAVTMALMVLGLILM